MNRKHLVTVDYENFLAKCSEIDVDRDMIRPTYRIIEFFERFDIPVTFFVNAPEIQAFYAQNHPSSEAIDKQLRDIVRRGHDIQMHWHPQWLQFKYQDGRWVNHSQIDYNKHTTHLQSYESQFASGLRLLRSYGCGVRAFRGGGYLIEPVEQNFKFLKQQGITHDSSVYDWQERVPVSRAIKQRNDGDIPPQTFQYNGLTEVPICSHQGVRWDMSGGTQEAQSLPRLHERFKAVEDPHFVMMGHNKQRLHFDLIEPQIAEATKDKANIFVTFSQLTDK